MADVVTGANGDASIDVRKLEEKADQSLGELFQELAQNTAVLVRKEVALAKTEVTGKAKVAAKDGALVASGAVLAVYASLLLVATLVLLLATAMALWVATLIVALAFAIGAAVLAAIGIKKLRRVEPKPRETIRTLKENKLWLREQMSR